MSKSTILAAGQITLSAHNTIRVELLEPVGEPARIQIIWPPETTVTTPARYIEATSAAMRILGNASTELSRINAGRRPSV